MALKAFNAYKANSVTTQTPGQLIVMLYEGAIKFLRETCDALEKNDFVKKGEKMGKALDIITELNAVLDMEAGGEIALNLRKLYLFMQEHLTMAGIQKDTKAIKDVIGILEKLNSGWKEIAA